MSHCNNIDERLLEMWDYLSNKKLMGTVTHEKVEDLASQKGLEVKSIEEVSFGFSGRIDGIMLKTDARAALFPRQRLCEIELYTHNKEIIEQKEHFWHAVDWFLPPLYIKGEP